MAATTKAIAVVDSTMRTSLPRIDLGRRRNSGRRKGVSLIGRSLQVVCRRPAVREPGRAVKFEVRRSWADAVALHANRHGEQLRADLEADPIGCSQRHL